MNSEPLNLTAQPWQSVSGKIIFELLIVKNLCWPLAFRFHRVVINFAKWRNFELNNRTAFLLIPVAGILALMFFIGGPDYYSPRSYQHFWDLGHIIFFATLSYLILSLWKNLAEKSFLSQIAWIFAVTLLLGVIIEQSHPKIWNLCCPTTAAQTYLFGLYSSFRINRPSFFI